MIVIPPGATHYSFFYGKKLFYRRMEMKYLNEVSEEWQTLVKYYEYDSIYEKWIRVESGFCDRRLTEISK